MKTLKIKKFAFYGTSYGTMWATVTADLIEKDPSLDRPKFVVLQGALGRAFKGDEEAYNSCSWSKKFLAD